KYDNIIKGNGGTLMITIDLNLNNKTKKVSIKDDILFNALLAKNKKIIKKLIRSIKPFYKISDAFFEIVNNFVDFSPGGKSLYAGLIVRVGLCKYAVLYLESSRIDEEYMISLIDSYIHDVGDYRPGEVEVDKIEIKREAFINILKKL
ncbi:MAG TPA: hypothetical protein DCY94_04215, partial [Firmicutes bacterium]|nr:hypothetical protein [Bacillota bacterium]